MKRALRLLAAPVPLGLCLLLLGGAAAGLVVLLAIGQMQRQAAEVREQQLGADHQAQGTAIRGEHARTNAALQKTDRQLQAARQHLFGHSHGPFPQRFGGTVQEGNTRAFARTLIDPGPGENGGAPAWACSGVMDVHDAVLRRRFAQWVFNFTEKIDRPAQYLVIHPPGGTGEWDPHRLLVEGPSEVVTAEILHVRPAASARQVDYCLWLNTRAPANNPTPRALLPLGSLPRAGKECFVLVNHLRAEVDLRAGQEIKLLSVLRKPDFDAQDGEVVLELTGKVK
jgi:hypothetical protein